MLPLWFGAVPIAFAYVLAACTAGLSAVSLLRAGAPAAALELCHNAIGRNVIMRRLQDAEDV